MPPRASCRFLPCSPFDIDRESGTVKRGRASRGLALAETGYAADLQQRYQGQARDRVLGTLRADGARCPIEVDELAAVALASPMTSIGDLKSWLASWCREGRLEYKGMGPKTRVPKIGKGHRVWWRER